MGLRFQKSSFFRTRGCHPKRHSKIAPQRAWPTPEKHLEWQQISNQQQMVIFSPASSLEYPVKSKGCPVHLLQLANVKTLHQKGLTTEAGNNVYDVQ